MKPLFNHKVIGAILLHNNGPIITTYGHEKHYKSTSQCLQKFHVFFQNLYFLPIQIKLKYVE